MYHFQTTVQMSGSGVYESNRARTVTSDSSISYASSESSLCSGNRSRSNTGDSFSSSDNSTTVPIGPDGKPLQGARRRSHRPRGCRGGRKNRKNKERARSQTPNSKQDLPLSQRENILPFPVALHGEKSFEPTIPQPPGFLETGNCPSPSVALMPPPARLQPRSNSLSSRSMFRPLSDDSKTVSVANSISCVEGSNFHLSDDILPPAPKLGSSPSPTMMQGPNPYALNSQHRITQFRNVASNATSATGCISANNLPSIATCVSLDLEEVLGPPFTADGSSLFATSPRSFLMGANNSNIVNSIVLGMGGSSSTNGKAPVLW